MRLKITPEALSVNHFDVRIAIGVAGNEEDGVTVRNYYRDANGNWTEIQGNSYPLTQLPLDQLNQVLLNKKPTIDLQIPNEAEFYEVAEEINKIMHEAKVNKSDHYGLFSFLLFLQCKKAT